MAYEEAQQLLKSQSHLSLTVLKPSISTASSHRSSLSLGMIIGDVNIEGNTNNNNKTNVVTNESADSLTSSIDGTSHTLPLSLMPSHGNGTSNMSDYEIKNALIVLTEEQERRESRRESSITINNQQSPPFFKPGRGRVFDTSFGSSIVGGVGAGLPPSSRPRSITSITNSINSSGSGAGRISSPPTRSDPLALDWMGIHTTGPASITTSETSVHSASQQTRIRKAQNGRTSFTTAPALHQNTDFVSDRHTTISNISHASTTTSKRDSSRSVYDESAEFLDTAIHDADSTVESAVSSLQPRMESARSSTVSVASSSRPPRKTGGTHSYSPASSKRSITGITRRSSENKSNRYKRYYYYYFFFVC